MFCWNELTNSFPLSWFPTHSQLFIWVCMAWWSWQHAARLTLTLSFLVENKFSARLPSRGRRWIRFSSESSARTEWRTPGLNGASCGRWQSYSHCWLPRYCGESSLQRFMSADSCLQASSDLRIANVFYKKFNNFFRIREADEQSYLTYEKEQRLGLC